jgi:hypothetical protein
LFNRNNVQFCNLLTAVLYTLETIAQFCNLLTAVLYTLETIDKTAVSKLQNCTIVTKVYKTAVNKLQNWPMNKDGITYVKVNIVNIIFGGNIECILKHDGSN